MVIFTSEEHLCGTIDTHDRLVRECVEGQLAFEDFLDQYDNFYFRYALDGHESDEEEQRLLAKYAARIRVHECIATEILGRLGPEGSAHSEVYRLAGRIGPVEAARRLSDIAR